MSAEEETELRDLVAQTLEVNGCLPKLRAQLRASIFLALDDDDDKQKLEPLNNGKIKKQLESKEGRIMFCLVREFLEYFDLDFTISVYEPESYLGTGYEFEGRSKLIDDLGLTRLKENNSSPLLLQLIQIAQLNGNNKNLDINLRKLQMDGFCDKEDQSQIRDGEVNARVEISLENSSSSEENNSLKSVLNPAGENFNATFDISNPSIRATGAQIVTDDKSPVVKNPLKTEEKDDTYDGTSSIAEDSAAKDSPDKSSNNSESEFSPPILREKIKLSPQKTEKLKTKGSLSSLADLPPLQLNKSRNDTVLLPSLYSNKEIKEKNNMRELEKYFDVDSLDQYEEDFMSDSEINLNKSLDSSKNNFLDELESSSVTESIKNLASSQNSNKNCLSNNSQNKPDKNSESDRSGSFNSSSNSVASETSMKTNFNVDNH